MWLKLAIFSILLLPGTAFSQVVIGEIMYDLEGSDTDREWIEIFNESSSSVDLSGWRFFEGTSNHKLTLKQGGATLESGEYAVIVDDDVTFLIDWPNYSGALFDSSF
ncbi:MAG: lamin tail domain-containing protein, partial [Candidatus Pacebacteria bacterium]|nr:lamin tail domain-containing protein [Candidatus Paceibacterota bacterium]